MNHQRRPTSPTPTKLPQKKMICQKRCLSKCYYKTLKALSKLQSHNDENIDTKSMKTNELILSQKNHHQSGKSRIDFAVNYTDKCLHPFLQNGKCQNERTIFFCFGATQRAFNQFIISEWLKALVKSVTRNFCLKILFHTHSIAVLNDAEEKLRSF